MDLEGEQGRGFQGGGGFGGRGRGLVVGAESIGSIGSVGENPGKIRVGSVESSQTTGVDAIQNVGDGVATNS